jgi:hypothetical protein
MVTGRHGEILSTERKALYVNFPDSTTAFALVVFEIHRTVPLVACVYWSTTIGAIDETIGSDKRTRVAKVRVANEGSNSQRAVLHEIVLGEQNITLTIDHIRMSLVNISY